MARLMRCLYCGLLQDEPSGVKQCARCGGELAFEQAPPSLTDSYLNVTLELDQVHAQAGVNVDRYLLVTLETPREVPAEHAAPPQAQRPPLHLAAVIDVSGSMNSEDKIDYAIEALRQALYFLQDGDIFSLVTFESEVKCLIQPTPFGPKVRQQVESLLSELRTGNMTALDGGLEMGIQIGRQTSQVTTLVLLLSDGQANVGETDLEKIAYRATQARQEGLVVSTLGVGMDYNEALLVEIANQGGGRFYHIQQADQIPAALMQELGSTAALAARGVELELDLPPRVALVSLTSLYPVVQTDNVARVQVGDLLPGVRVELILRLTLYPHRADERLRIGGRVRYRSPAGRDLAAELNVVTVRFVSEHQFKEKPGLVPPVMERVLALRRAASLLESNRLQAQSPHLALRYAEDARRTLREYAAMFSAEKADELDEELSRDWEEMLTPGASPNVRKVRVERAARILRGL